MARPLRIEYPGAVYHITSRGNERKNLFFNDTDRLHFIQLLKEGSDFFKVEVISYCLMNNHFHLLLKTKEANLSRFMQYINTSYTRNFNIRYRRIGHLFQGRYKAIVVGSDEYLLVLSRYIHLNPINIQELKDKSKKDKEILLHRYKWSSFLEVIDPSKRSKYLYCSKVLEHAGGDTPQGRKRYMEYVFKGINSKEKSPMEEVKIQLILGSEKFTEWIKDKFIKGKDKRAYPHIKGIDKPKDIKLIAKAVAKGYGISEKEIYSMRSNHREARQVLMELSYAANRRVMSLKEIGDELGGITGSAVSQVHKRIQAKIKEDKILAKKLDVFVKELSIVEA